MTVIVYKNKVMGSDSRISDDDSSIFSNKSKKIHQLKNGSMIGLAGDADHRAVVDFFNKIKGMKLPSSKQIVSIGTEFDALLWLPNDTLWFVSAGKKDKNEEWFAQVLEIKDPFAAIGSGGKYATGALDRGATVEQAIKTAIKYDPSCGGQVQLFNIEVLS